MRVEFAGRELAPDLNATAVMLNGVGAGTVLDHVQVHRTTDDCFAWFGGTVDARFLVATACGNDGFDWQLGYTGTTQFALGAQEIGTVISGGNGLEGDNNENGWDLLPRSHPKLCNVTALGTRGQPGTPSAQPQDGGLAKLLVAGFARAGLDLQHPTPGCTAGPALTGELLVRDSLFFDNGPTGAEHCASGAGASTPSPCSGCEFYDLLANDFGLVPTCAARARSDASDQNPAVDPGVPLGWPPADPRPTNAAAVANGFDCATLDPAFVTTGYLGAFDPNGANWLAAPWVSLAAN